MESYLSRLEGSDQITSDFNRVVKDICKNMESVVNSFRNTNQRIVKDIYEEMVNILRSIEKNKKSYFNLREQEKSDSHHLETPSLSLKELLDDNHVDQSYTQSLSNSDNIENRITPIFQDN